MLMLPKLTSDSLPGLETNQALRECCAAAGGICRAYKVLFRESFLGYSLHALNTVFLAAVTLVFYLWDLGKASLSSIQNDIRACSSLLFVFAERLPDAKSHSELFENLVEIVEIGKSSPRDGGSPSTSSPNTASECF
ncbi:uncharacterized protein RJT20DRAFT_16760 [Scheffersomyces xylosifermentans]|uniref:uncharacterized protein n=1 Tax=Scheffersomyces xylosifermentans TaxID=1304137 RepID=UPI00315D7FF7